MEKEYLTISQFSALSGISRKTLIYYDKIDLFSPKMVTDKGYRMYEEKQLDTISVIYILRELGKSIKEIKIYLQERTPEKMLSLFLEEQKQIDKKISTLQQYKDMLEKRIELTKLADVITVGKLTFIQKEKKPILIGKKINQQNNEALIDFYSLIDQQQIVQGFPIGAIIGKNELTKGEFSNFSYFYINKSTEDKNQVSIKPEGSYAVMYDYCDYNKTEKMYQTMLDGLSENGYEIDGDAYEEYIIDEVAEKNPEKYLVKVMIKVRNNK
ncbi:MerR family transcriptional regulator [Carnobacterium inhibens]|uniref:MerR family transcriptional regulator n=1 Tax=Carnobacterium inhibens TaxID=147709 RepID=UPI00203E8925|nr:MerR family transcriptional regulator [Carnobacterium inhibens]MCM3513319.1 MerR family transcriptional regulator [Carnobacterium inhibens]